MKKILATLLLIFVVFGFELSAKKVEMSQSEKNQRKMINITIEHQSEMKHNQKIFKKCKLASRKNKHKIKTCELKYKAANKKSSIKSQKRMSELLNKIVK